MRNRFFIYLGALALLAAGCTDYEPDSVLVGTHTRLGLEENAFKAHWDTGDQVQVFAMNGTEPVNSYVFTAGSTGLVSDFVCPTDVAGTTSYRFVYPSQNLSAVTSEGICATVPVEQRVVSGAIPEESLLFVGEASTLMQTAYVTPVLAYLRFSLAGGAAQQVKKITFSSSSTLAGSIAFYDVPSTHSRFFDKPSDGANPSNYITLSGDFESGGTYTAAVVPGQRQVSLKAVVEDASGAIHSFDFPPVDFTAGEVTEIDPIYLGHSLVDEGDLIPVMTATKGVRPIVLMFLPDGWVEGTGEGSREEFVKASREAISYMFNVEPFKSNSDFFTVYIAWKAAAEAGVGNTFGAKVGVWYENYLGLTAEARKAVCDYAEQVCPEIQQGITHPRDMGLFLLVNGRQNYGAVCEWSEPRSENEGRFVAVVDYSGTYVRYEDLGPGVMPQSWGGTGGQEYRLDAEGNSYVYSLTEDDFRDLGYVNYAAGKWGYLGTWKNTMLHEGFGHGFGRLDDEYWTTTGGYNGKSIAGHTMTPPRSLNVSASKDNYPWKVLLDMRDELIAQDPRYARIGVYQGGMARYATGIWRPEWTSAMNDLRPYFGVWDRALIYQRIMQMSGLDPDFDVRKEADLRTFLARDLATNGNFDPMRDR